MHLSARYLAVPTLGALLALGLILPLLRPAAPPAVRFYVSGYVADGAAIATGGVGARALAFTRLPPPLPLAPPAAPAALTVVEAQAAGAASIGAPLASGGPTILDNPNDTAIPAGYDPDRPYGPPVARTDWVISKDYAAHGGHGQWGAIDFAYWGNLGAAGSPIVATQAGRVHLVPGDPVYGNWLWVMNEHFTTRYGHTQKYLVAEGQAVVRGTVLAEMGSTGMSTGPHVDYQVWEDNDNKDPTAFLK